MDHVWTAIFLLHISATLVPRVDARSYLSETREGNKTNFSGSGTSFSEWFEWHTQYKSCNPENNPNTSPVDISSTKAVKLDTQTLMVFSRKPEEDLYLFSTSYEEDKVQMESLNIKLMTDDTNREATHINGLGSVNHRFFKSALIMFRPKDDEPIDREQRYHTVDQIEYPMEIMFNFETPMHKEKTQIHVMVELAEEENPVWRPILDTFLDLKAQIINENCLGEAKWKSARDALNKTDSNYKAAIERERNDTKGQTYEKTVSELTALLHIMISTNETMENLVNRQLSALVRKHNCEQEMITLNLAANQLEKPIPQNKSAKTSASLRACIEEESQKAEELEVEWDRQSKLLKRTYESYEALPNRTGSVPTTVFSSVEIVAQTLDSMKNNIKELKTAKNAYGEAKNAVNKLLSMPKRSVFIKEPFQISWLFPPVGGYFYYDGSSPIPPCKRRSYVIVLEMPITINVEQLKQFQEFPSFTHAGSSKDIQVICKLKESGEFDDSLSVIEVLATMGKIKLQVPASTPLGDRIIWYNQKNIQFKGDDGLHMESSKRAKLKERSDTKENHSPKNNKDLLTIVVNFVFIYIPRLILSY